MDFNRDALLSFISKVSLLHVEFKHFFLKEYVNHRVFAKISGGFGGKTNNFHSSSLVENADKT